MSLYPSIHYTLNYIIPLRVIYTDTSHLFVIYSNNIVTEDLLPISLTRMQFINNNLDQVSSNIYYFTNLTT